MPGYLQFPFVVLVTTASWMLVTFLTPAEPQSTLESFYRKTRPGGPGWKKVADAAEGALEPEADGRKIAPGILAALVGTFLVYSVMFGTGYWLYGRYALASVFTVLAVVFAGALAKVWKALRRK